MAHSQVEPRLWLPKPNIEAIKQHVKSNVMQSQFQLRFPYFLAVLLGRFNTSYCWLIIIMLYAKSLYVLFRSRHAELCSYAEQGPNNKSKEASKATGQHAKTPTSSQEARSVVLEPGTDNVHQPIVCFICELYLHIFTGLIAAYHVGYCRLDLLLMLPLVESVIAVERFFPSIHRQCQKSRAHSRTSTQQPGMDVKVSDAQSEIFLETMHIRPVEVQDEWFNLLLAQLWDALLTGWLSDYVRAWIETFTANLGIITEVVDFGTRPLQVRRIDGKKRTTFDKASFSAKHPNDWIYDLDLHLELYCHELNIRLVYPIAGFRIPIYIDRLQISGAFRVELEFLELDEHDGRASNPMFPGLCGMKIYFIERPMLHLSLWLGGVLDLVAIPLVGWIVQRFVVDNIVCYKLELGPTFEGQRKRDLQPYNKILKLKERDRKRTAEADMGESMGISCRLSIKVVSALNLPPNCKAYVVLTYGSPEEHDDKKNPLPKMKCRWHDGEPAYVWDSVDDKPFEWTPRSDKDILHVEVMSVRRTGDDETVGVFKTTLGDLRRDLQLTSNTSSKIKVCQMENKVRSSVNLEVRFKSVIDLLGIDVNDGTTLKEAQEIQAHSEVFASQTPLRHVGGVLRIRLFRIDCLPKKFRQSPIFVRLFCGHKNSYGARLQETKHYPQSNGGSQYPTHYIEKVTQSQGTKSGLNAKTSVTKATHGSGLSREWKDEGIFEFDIVDQAPDNLIALQVWRDDKLGEHYLGGTYLPIARLEALHNGALFKKIVFREVLFCKGNIVLDDSTKHNTTINFLAELVPDIKFA